MTILLCGRPGSSAGHLVAEPVRLAPDGVWLAAVSPRRWWALTPPFHPYLRRLARSVAGGLLSVPLSVGFRRLGFPQRPALWCPDFPRADERPAVTRPARRIVARPRRAWPPRAGSRRTPGTQSRHPCAGRTRRRPGTRGSRRGRARAAPGRASGEATPGPSREAPEDADDLAEDRHVLRIHRLERVVLGLEPDAAALAEEGLDRRLLGP